VRRRLEALRADREAGVTLVELMIAIMLGAIIMAMIGGFFMQTTRITSTAVQSNTTNGLASSAMQEITTVVRLATQLSNGTATATPPVISASSTKLVISSLVSVTTPSDPAPTQVTFDSSSGSIIESRCVATKSNGFWTFSTCASSSSRSLGGPVVGPDAGQNALFSYLDSNGNTLTLTNGNLASTSNGSVASIVVSVKMQAAGQTILPPVYLTANVGMPNIGLQQAAS
jgi:type II secretory pathway pseudopilin PulG